MYCNKCGNEINENERFCKYCGAPVEKLDEQVNGEKLDESLQKQTKKKIKWLVLILVLILIIAIALTIVLVMNERQSNATGNQTGNQDDWKVVEDEESQTTEQEIALEIVTENSSTEETQERQKENISNEPEKDKAPEVRMRYVKDVSASSYLSEKNIKHVTDRIMDGDTTTAWVEGVEGNGEGESITFTFGDLYVVSDIKIWNGYQKSEDLYYKNARPSELELEFSDGSTERILLQDMASGFQEFALERHVTSYVKVKIISTYEGSKYEDTVISEIELQ